MRPERLIECSGIRNYLIDNVDRWSADFTNVQTLGRDGPLIYLHNANGFALRPKPSQLSEARVTFVQRFRRSTVAAIRHLDLSALQRRMSTDPLAPLLSQSQWLALDVRRQRLLSHVDHMHRAHGSRAFPW